MVALRACLLLCGSTERLFTSGGSTLIADCCIALLSDENTTIEVFEVLMLTLITIFIGSDHIVMASLKAIAS